MLISSERAIPDRVSPDRTTYVFGTAGLPDGLGDGDGLGDADGEGLGVGDSLGLAVGVASTEGVGVASLGVVSVPIMEVRANSASHGAARNGDDAGEHDHEQHAEPWRAVRWAWQRGV